MKNAHRLAFMLLLCFAPFPALAQQAPGVVTSSSQDPVPPQPIDDDEGGCFRDAEGVLQCPIGVVITVIKKD